MRLPLGTGVGEFAQACAASYSVCEWKELPQGVTQVV
jgi:hypothetical protein